MGGRMVWPPKRTEGVNIRKMSINMADINSGVSISGGTINADQFAAGQNARAYKGESSMTPSAELQHIYAKLDELEKAIQRHGADLERPDDLMSAAKAVKVELASEKPNKITVTSILSGIAESVRSIASIASLAETLRTAVGGLF
jgi:hypothetical protein